MDRDIAQQGTVSPTSNGRLNGFQTGTDLWAHANWRAGLYLGQLEGDMAVRGQESGAANYSSGRNDLRSQYLGGYATWQRDSLSLDAVLQLGRHRYTATPAEGESSAGKGDSLMASLEAVQGFALSPRWQIEPSVQVAYQHLSLDDTGLSGATVQQDTDGSWIVRAGVRVKGLFNAGPGALRPYASFNLYKRSNSTDVTRFAGGVGGTDISSRTGGNSSELSLGASWQLSPRTSLYGELSQLWELGGDARTDSGISGGVGVRVLW
ncbi:autotransporter outer membrane beta-barrel domain-containing protein [Hydrogenophaga sp.]|uniref:autotransporter domain-containing protein n=1 Tax=Hydrogenophaga sp. TaxID=1904254 RepID=UPI0025B7FBD6|nr:autotransporter outer membrane beta-barrel domain-containing protein [Hydrogenophaga sp.]